MAWVTNVGGCPINMDAMECASIHGEGSEWSVMASMRGPNLVDITLHTDTTEAACQTYLANLNTLLGAVTVSAS